MTATKTVPTTRVELLAYTEKTWHAFVACTDALADEQWTGPTDAAGWSVKDHVVHIVIWVRAEIALLRHRTPMQQSLGIPDAVWNAGWSAGDFGPINELNRQQMIGDSPADVRAERDRVFPKLVQAVSGLTDDDLARPATDYGLDEPEKTLLTVLTEYHGDHFVEHQGYVERIVAGG